MLQSQVIMKILLVIIDGLGDRPISALGNKTPLEAAKTPNLDFFAKNGICGQVKPFLFPREKTPTSEGAHIALFGYQRYFLGRGPYEVAGIGMKMKKGDIAFRVNFATVNSNLKIIDRRAGRISDTKSLIKSLSGITIDGIKFLVKESYGHRLGLIMRGKGLSMKISDGDPKKVGVKSKKIIPLNKSKQAKFTADVLNKFLNRTYEILKKHSLNKKRIKKGKLPANYLLIRGAGIYKESPSFKKKYNLKACCIAGGGLYKGVAKILGMDIIKVKGATGFANTNLKGKFLAAKKAFKKYNFVFCHIKATDTFGHDGDFIGKKEFIEKTDKSLKSLLKLKNTLIVVTADHSTPCELKDHSADFIPFLIYKKNIKKGQVKEFSEKACQKGKLGKIKQTNLMKKILTFTKI